MENALVQYSLSSQENDFEVQFEALPVIDMSDVSDSRKKEIMESVASIDKQQSFISQRINELSTDINRLTNNADGFDYMVAVASGIISGLIDGVFVGDFSLDDETQWGKNKVDAFVKSVAKRQGYSGDSLEGAVRFLEQKYPIPADSATDIFGGGYYHHLRDFSHHPTPVGLLFSMLTQFTGKVFGTDTLGSFIIEDVPCEDFIGKDLPSKLSIGFVHWIFHMVSDIAGSSSSIADGKYGTGLPGPFVSLLKELSSLPFFCHEKNNNEFCVWVSKLFNGTLLSQRDTNGKIIPDSLIKFDLRAEIGVMHALEKQTIPIIINECMVRIFYFVRRLIDEFKTKEINTFHDFIYVLDWKNTLPFNNRTIVRMMTISSGTFVAIDIADAAIRSAITNAGQIESPTFWTDFILRVNFVGIGRFAIAIGTDVYMGNKKERLREERIALFNQMIILTNAKAFFKEAGMWEKAEDATIAVDELYKNANRMANEVTMMFEDRNTAIDNITLNIENAQRKNPIIDKLINNIL